MKTYRPNAIFKNIYLENEKSMYKVGNDGSILTLSKKHRILKPQISRDGYAMVTLHNLKE